MSLLKTLSSSTALAVITCGPAPVMWTAIVVVAAAALLAAFVVVVYIVSEGKPGKRARQLVDQIVSRHPPDAPRRKPEE